jgi:hypothetical protein
VSCVTPQALHQTSPILPPGFRVIFGRGVNCALQQIVKNLKYKILDDIHDLPQGFGFVDDGQAIP